MAHGKLISWVLPYSLKTGYKWSRVKLHITFTFLKIIHEKSVQAQPSKTP